MRIDQYLRTPEQRPPHAPIWALGFRPFFLLATLQVVLWLPLWLVVHLVGPDLPLVFDPGSWHAHELIFGFAGAVLAGFLLTASRNWTSGKVPTGHALIALAALWGAGRFVMVLGASWPPVLVAVVATGFLPVVAFLLAHTLLKAKNRRNYAFPVMLLVLSALQISLFALDASERRVLLRTSLDLVTLFLVVMGGRVIPFFTRNALKGVEVSTPTWLAWTATLSAGALVPAGLLWGTDSTAVSVVALAAGVLNLVRLAGWASPRTLKNPLLWVLHLGYLWVPLGFLIRGLSPWVPALSGPALVHALAVGALGTLVFGMMARVALGHTGRPLLAPRPMVWAFVLPSVAALVRVFMPVVSMDLYGVAMVVSGLAMSLAALVFLVVYTPILMRPRADGAMG